MAKSARPGEGHEITTSSARPRGGGRRTDRQPKPANSESAESPGSSAETPDPFKPQDLASPDAQDFSSASQTERDQAAASGPTEHEIRLRAYRRYLDRGAFDGADFDDWIAAEMELKKR